MADLDRRQFGDAGHQVIGEGDGQGLALRVVWDFLVQRGADALHDAAADLPFDDHRIDHRAAILGDREVDQLDEAGLGIDRDDRAMRRIGEDAGADLRGSDRLAKWASTLTDSLWAFAEIPASLYTAAAAPRAPLLHTCVEINGSQTG
jgi:hypothetical protein